MVGAQPERGQNPSKAATRTEEALHSGIGVEHSELLDERGARRNPVAERGEACDFAVEVEVAPRRRRDLQGLGGNSSDWTTCRKRRRKRDKFGERERMGKGMRMRRFGAEGEHKTLILGKKRSGGVKHF